MKTTPVPLPFSPRACPVCDGRSTRPLFQQRFHALGDAALLRGYDLVACDRCGCGYADRIPDQAAFDDYYRALSKYEYGHRDGQETAHDLARFAAMADIIQRHLPASDARVLDVGCATGGLLSVLKGRGYSRVTGLDPSPACADAARRLYGIRVLTGTLGDFPSDEENGFDFLILVGVLEHVSDLAALLAQVQRLLTPSGWVYVEVPDAVNFLAGRNAPFQEFSIEHINYFSPRSLGSLMTRTGFREVEVEQCVREASHGTTAPVIWGVYQKGVAETPGLVRDEETERGLRAYIAHSCAAEEHEHQFIAGLVDAREPLIVWGVGTHTLRLLATSRLPEANVVAFVDSNPKVQGKSLNGVPILAPAALLGRRESILISSWGYQREIRQQIRDQLKLPNPILVPFESALGEVD
jgi:SAM-dependent methyltransferase